MWVTPQHHEGLKHLGFLLYFFKVNSSSKMVFGALIISSGRKRKRTGPLSLKEKPIAQYFLHIPLTGAKSDVRWPINPGWPVILPVFLLNIS